MTTKSKGKDYVIWQHIAWHRAVFQVPGAEVVKRVSAFCTCGTVHRTIADAVQCRLKLAAWNVMSGGRSSSEYQCHVFSGSDKWE